MEPNGNSPATKADIAQLKEFIERVEERVEERLERVETNLLTEFHKWAQTYEVRSRGTIQVVHNFEERLVILEERVGNLERRRP
jgi:phage shock protein A